jgi:hypothetical protein
LASINLLPGETEGDWVVLGFLENRSDFHIADVQIEILLRDDQGTLLEDKQISPLLPHIAPGEKSPFSANFLSIGNMPTFEVEVVSISQAALMVAEVEFEILSTTPTEGGKIAILGQVENPNPFTVNLDGLGLAAFSSKDELVALAPHVLSLSQLNPGEDSPVMILIETGVSEHQLVAYVSASKTVPISASDKLISESPRVIFTQQGIPFVVGRVRNDGSQPIHAALIMIIEADGEMLAMGEVVLPKPLEPGDTQAFAAADFPGLSARLRERSSIQDDLKVRVLVDRGRSTPSILQPITLEVEIDLFEPIGSSIVLRGTVTNPTDADVKKAVVMVAVHSTAGELLTAGWVINEDILTPGAASLFTLPLYFPEDSEPAASEYDIRAVGFAP